ncbi:MAG TPA: metallopeptidase TldD-related protein [Terriglobia bacterium]|nr:metallopeptidase TldD-related protein [Terriglobia bacterium]
MKQTKHRKNPGQSKRTAWFSTWFMLTAALVSMEQNHGVLQGAQARAGAPAASSDPVLKAMGDELDRSITQLKLNDLDKPYFIQYVVYDDEDFTASATFGALSRSSSTHQRLVHAQVRVGDYDFDNTGFAGARGGQSTGVLSQASLDDDYDALRHELWLATDSAYKSAVETIAQKRAYTQNRTAQDDPLPDFSKEKATNSISAKMKMQLDKTKLENQLREWSKIFRDFPAVQTSNISYHARLNHRYIVNSEGTHTLEPSLVLALQASASTQAADGMQITMAIPFSARSFDDMPSAAAVSESIRQMAKDVTALRNAPVLDANYSGPALLVGQASAEMFARVLAPNLTEERGPIGGRGGQTSGSALLDRMKRPVLPANISVYDDPTQTKMVDKALVGFYPIDDQGIPSQRVSLVEDGLLTNLLTSRRPSKERPQSNGHGRGVPGRETAQVSNFVVKVEKDGKSYDELKQELMKLAKDERLDYGIMIKMLSGNQGAIGTPILTYKVYVTDGREELIRGASASGLTVQSLRHIQSVGSDMFVDNRLIGTQGAETPTSVVAPSVILEELALDRPTGTQQKPATLTNPYFSN